MLKTVVVLLIHVMKRNKFNVIGILNVYRVINADIDLEFYDHLRKLSKQT